MVIKSLNRAFLDLAIDGNSVSYDGAQLKTPTQGFKIYQARNRLAGCCGIDELDLRTFSHAVWPHLDAKYKKEALAKLIYCGKRNKPIVFGLPVKLSTTTSYNRAFYVWLKPILKEWGFVPVSRQYVNLNSSNILVMYCGFMP